jgi:hypothetical protein
MGIIIIIIIGGVELSPLGTAATPGLLYKPQMIDEGDCGAIVGFVVDKVALGQVFSEYFGFPCQISFHHDQTRARTRAAAVGSQRLTA